MVLGYSRMMVWGPKSAIGREWWLYLAACRQQEAKSPQHGHDQGGRLGRWHEQDGFLHATDEADGGDIAAVVDGRCRSDKPTARRRCQKRV